MTTIDGETNPELIAACPIINPPTTDKVCPNAAGMRRPACLSSSNKVIIIIPSKGAGKGIPSLDKLNVASNV